MKDFDCQRCGACCCNPERNRAEAYVDYVQVFDADALMRNAKLARRFVVLNARGERHMRLDKDGRCAALVGEIGRSVTCRVYVDRPNVCRKMEPGGDRCLAARREHGLEPPNAPSR